MDFLKIDAENKLSFREATMNMLVLGGIGRGKTTNFMQPAVQALIAAGHSGLIVDVKNNFASKVRLMAAYYGREKDVIELGNRETATPVNIVRGLPRDELKNILQPDTASHREPAWALGGWKMCCDMIDILYFLQRKSGAHDFEASLALLAFCMNEIGMSRALYEYFKSMAYNPDDFEQFCLVERIENEMFHMLNVKNEKDEYYFRHVQWELITIRETLRGFVGEGTYSHNFSNPDSDFVMDFQKLLHEQNKIVVLRFDNNSSQFGKILATMAKMKLYADIYRSDPEKMPQDRFTFQVIDEFQDVFLPYGGMGDLAWFAKSREYNHINVVSCQSMSSLYRGADSSAVHEIITNCSCKALLQTEDVATTEYFARYPIHKPLFALEGSEAYFTKFDLATRGMSTKLVDTGWLYARYMTFQEELKRLVLPDAEQPSQTALKEQVIRLRLVVGLPAPGEVKDEDAKPYSAQGDIKDEEKDGQTVVMSFPSDAFGPSKPEQNRFRREMQKKYNKELKQGYLQGRVRKLKRPGGFKRMDSTARKIQARQARREAVEAAKQAQPTKEAQEAIQATAEDIQLEIQQVKLETLENGGSIWADTGTDAKQ